MKKIYYILSFIIAVGYVIFLQGYHMKYGAQCEVPTILTVLAYIIGVNSIVALTMYIFSTPQKEIDEIIL